jgi:UDP:flavonoid glycosyltransferase YjiC (YdhE family)
MRFVLASAGSRGDVHPMMALALGLEKAGHHAALAAPKIFEVPARRLGIAFHEFGQDIQALLSRASKDVSSPARTLRTMIHAMREEAILQFEHMGKAALGADMIVGTAATLAARSVAEARRLPYRYAAFCPQLFPSRHHPPPPVPWQGAPQLLNGLFWRLNDMLWNRVVLDTVNAHRSRLGLGRLESFWRHAMSDRPMVAADPELAPLPRDLVGRVDQTGPWLLANQDPLPGDVEAFLEAGPRPLYIGFGSMTDPDPGGTTRLVMKALRISGQRALVSPGWAGLGRIPLPDSVKAIGEVSHERLFHKVALVVHHGGAGTTATAARAGVPQIVVPHLLDQNYWAGRVWRLGIGPRPIPRSRLSAESLAHAISRALDEPEFERRARDLGLRLGKRDGVALAVRLLAAPY